MPETPASTARLTKFYGELTSLDAILAGLSAAGVHTDRFDASELYNAGSRLSQPRNAHDAAAPRSSGSLSTASPAPTTELLDLGCGLGGPGRFLVDQFGCSVVGVDLLELRIDIAQALTDHDRPR